MNSNAQAQSHPLEPFDLMPPDYVEKHHAHRATFLWVSVITALSAILISVNGVNYFDAARMRRRHLELATKAIPVHQLREHVTNRQSRLDAQRRHLELAAATQPDDSAVQLIGAIGRAAEPLAGRIQIETIKIRLPCERATAPGERDADTPGAPDPKTLVVDGEITIRIQVSDLKFGRQFAVALSQQPRIRTVAYKIAEANADRSAILIVATPKTHRVLP